MAGVAGGCKGREEWRRSKTIEVGTERRKKRECFLSLFLPLESTVLFASAARGQRQSGLSKGERDYLRKQRRESSKQVERFEEKKRKERMSVWSKRPSIRSFLFFFLFFLSKREKKEARSFTPLPKPFLPLPSPWSARKPPLLPLWALLSAPAPFSRRSRPKKAKTSRRGSRSIRWCPLLLPLLLRLLLLARRRSKSRRRSQASRPATRSSTEKTAWCRWRGRRRRRRKRLRSHSRQPPPRGIAPSSAPLLRPQGRSSRAALPLGLKRPSPCRPRREPRGRKRRGVSPRSLSRLRLLLCRCRHRRLLLLSRFRPPRLPSPRSRCASSAAQW